MSKATRLILAVFLLSMAIPAIVTSAQEEGQGDQLALELYAEGFETIRSES